METPGHFSAAINSLDGAESVRPEMLAMMAANLPARGDDGAIQMFGRLLDNEPLFAKDSMLRDFEYILSQQSAMLDGDGDERFQAAMRSFRDDPDVAGSRARLRSVFDSLLELLRAKRTSRVLTAPLDVTRVKAVIDTVSDALLGGSQPIGAFAPCTVRRVEGGVEQIERNYRTFERGLFTAPPMSAIDFDEMPRLISEVVMGDLRTLLLWEFGHRPKEDVVVTTGRDVGAFLKQATSMLVAAGFGTGSVLLEHNLIGQSREGFPRS